MPIAKRVVEGRQEILGKQSTEYSTALSNLGAIYLANGDHAAAESTFRESLRVARQVFGEIHPDYATALNNLAALQHATGNVASAAENYERSVSVSRVVFGEDSAELAIPLE